MAEETRFIADVEAWVDKAEANLDAVMRQTCQEMAQRVIMRTPVDTGNAVGGWWSSLNGVGVPKWSEGHEMGRDAGLASLTEKAVEAKWGDVWAASNNVVYIRPLEYGHSQQAPEGMVRLTVAEGPMIVASIVASLSV